MRLPECEEQKQNSRIVNYWKYTLKAMRGSKNNNNNNKINNNKKCRSTKRNVGMKKETKVLVNKIKTIRINSKFSCEFNRKREEKKRSSETESTQWNKPTRTRTHTHTFDANRWWSRRIPTPSYLPFMHKWFQTAKFSIYNLCFGSFVCLFVSLCVCVKCPIEFGKR